MRYEPPAKLVELLTRLRLAAGEQWVAAAPLAARLAGELPDFESVWVDALAQARVLTPYQAAEINAGRAEGLVVGPYRVQRPLPGPHFAACCAARHVDTGRSVRLYRGRSQSEMPQTVASLRQLVARGEANPNRLPHRIVDSGARGNEAWAACSDPPGTPLARWMVEHGRFSPQAALLVLREVVDQLALFESAGIVHGDVGAAGLIVDASGHVALPAGGLRGILRPHEGYSFGDVPPEAFDYLAPERIAHGNPPDRAGDVYACGALSWHLLTGRAPFAGGNSLAKLRAVHAARLVDVRQFAPEAPDSLCQMISSCLQRDPSRRPGSFIELAEHLGRASRGGPTALAAALRGPNAWQDLKPGPRARRSASSTALVSRSFVLGSIVAVALIAVALAPLAWRERSGDNSAIARNAPATSAIVQGAASQAAKADKTSKIDPQVKLASAVDSPVEPPEPARVPDLILPAKGNLRLEQLNLQPRQRVRGRAGQRPLVSVSSRGLAVTSEEICFDGIDFVWEGPAEPGLPDERAMLVCQARGIVFRGCSFSSLADDPPAALTYRGAKDELPGLGGEVVFNDCVFDGLSAVVTHPGQGGLNLALHNCLCAAAGPIARLHQAPSVESPLQLSLERLTARGDTRIVECRYTSLPAQVGAIEIVADDSVLATSNRAGLVLFVGSEKPDALLASFRWNGQGSIVTPQVPLVVWRGKGQPTVWPEEDLNVAGLVRSDLEFVGSADGPPAASRVTRWQVPLRSDDPPGALVHSLSLPRR